MKDSHGNHDIQRGELDSRAGGLLRSLVAAIVVTALSLLGWWGWEWGQLML